MNAEVGLLVSGGAGSGLIAVVLGKVDAALVYAIILLSFGCLAQAATYLNHDVAWVLYSSREMLHGAVFGTDIVEPNPPLIWWISAVPAAVAGLFGTPVVGTFRVFVAALAASSLFVADRLLACQQISRAKRIAFLVTAAYLLTIAVHRDFGQREHFAVMLVLPYILAVAQRIEGRSLGSAAGFAIGVCAALGLAFKPYFLLVPLLLEAALQLKLRSLRLLVRPEALGGVFTVLVYAIAILVMAPTWLFDVLPDIQQIYWAFDRPLTSQWAVLAVKFALPVLVAAAVFSFNRSSQVFALVLAATGFAGAAIVQNKFYSYHNYPVLALLVLAAAAGIVDRRGRWKWPVTAMLVLMFIQNFNESAQSLINRSNLGPRGQQISAVVAFVAANSARDGSFLAVSTHPFPGFPTALYADRRWASTTNSQFYLPAVVRLRQSTGPADPALIAFAEHKARAAILHDLAIGPDVVLIDQSNYRHAIGNAKFDFLEFYLEDPKFRAVWSAYKQVQGPPRGFALYVRVRN